VALLVPTSIGVVVFVIIVVVFDLLVFGDIEGCHGGFISLGRLICNRCRGSSSSGGLELDVEGTKGE
jgi:hypothetical protein